MSKLFTISFNTSLKIFGQRSLSAQGCSQIKMSFKIVNHFLKSYCTSMIKTLSASIHYRSYKFKLFLSKVY